MKMLCAKCGEPVSENDEEILGDLVFHRYKNCSDEWLEYFTYILSQKKAFNETPDER